MPNCKNCADYRSLPNDRWYCDKCIPEMEDVSCLLKTNQRELACIRQELEQQNNDPADDWKKT